jgi:nucleoid-associated protein EbfC
MARVDIAFFIAIKMVGGIGGIVVYVGASGKNVENAKKKLAEKEVHAEAGSGLVKVTMNGRHVVKRLSIDPSLLQDDPDMIEDLIAAAINDAVRQADELHETEMASATNGMGLPPGMNGLF